MITGGRRGFLKAVAAGIAGTAAALIPSEAQTASRPRGEPERAFKGRLVHYVIPSRHCVEATMVEENYAGRAIVQYEQRPAAAGTTYYQSSLAGGPVPRADGGRPVIGTWHEAEGCPCARPYSEFYYGRKRRKEAEPLLSGDFSNTGYDESLAPIPVLQSDSEEDASRRRR